MLAVQKVSPLSNAFFLRDKERVGSFCVLIFCKNRAGQRGGHCSCLRRGSAKPRRRVCQEGSEEGVRKNGSGASFTERAAARIGQLRGRPKRAWIKKR